MSFITAQNLSLGYDKNVVTEDLNFRVDEGDYLCIVGENGSGKTTLMRTILGLQLPLGGQILFGDGLKKNEIGYLPQQTVVQKDFPASVEEIVLSGCQAHMGLRPFYTEKERSIVLKNMERMDIVDLKNRCYRELSGGQQQRVLLARALCAATKVILLDEPVSGLDPRVTLEMYELIDSLNKSGITIIMVSHDIAAAVKYASHVLHVGKKLFFGTKDEYVSSDVGRFFLNMEGGEML